MYGRTFRTRGPAALLPPSKEEMEVAAREVGLSGFAPDLVTDLVNLAGGGSIALPSEYRGEVASRVEEGITSPRKGYYSVKGNNTNYSSRSEAVAHGTEAAMRYHQNVCDFLQTLDLGKFPGETPLKQAMACLKLLSLQSGGGGNGDGEPLPIFINGQPEKVAQKLQESMDMVESMDSAELDLLDPDERNHSSEEGKVLKPLEMAVEISREQAKAMLDISRTLESFSKFQLRKQEKLEKDSGGEEVRTRPIEGLSELARVPQSAWAQRQGSPAYFLYKAVTHQLMVRERVTRTIKKQAVYILVDGSGSMRGPNHAKACGVVMNRLKAVMTGDAVVWVSTFDTTLSKAKKAESPEEAKDLMKDFRERCFSGGGTDIPAAVEAAHKTIEEAMASGALYRPEIVILTDDDGSAAQLSVAKVPGTRVHAFAIGSCNKALVAFAKATGGVGMEKF